MQTIRAICIKNTQLYLIPLAVLCFLMSPSAHAKKELVLAIHEWPPFASTQQPYFGIIPRIISKIMHDQNINVKFRFMHWSNALDKVVTEEVDGAIVWAMQDLKHDSFLFSDQIMSHRTIIYYRNSFPAPESLLDLLGMRVNFNPNYVYDYESYYLFKEGKFDAIGTKDDITAINMLLQGELDYVVTPYLTGRQLIKHQFPKAERDKLGYTTGILRFPNTHLIVNQLRPQSDEFIMQFNTALERLKNNGVFDRILEDSSYSRY